MPVSVKPAGAAGYWLGEIGIEWLGAAVPTAAPGQIVTTGYGISVPSIGGRLNYVLPYALGATTLIQFGFVAASQPSSTQPSTWYPGGWSIYGGNEIATILVGPQGLFQPTARTTWWVWLQIGGESGDTWGAFVWGTNLWAGTTLLQIGQLNVTN